MSSALSRKDESVFMALPIDKLSYSLNFYWILSHMDIVTIS
jgi:hypothetical protein